MDAIIFDTPEGKCFVQPHHIVGAFAHPKEDGKTMVVIVTGQTFSFHSPPEEVWEELQKQIKDINTERQRGIAELVAAVTQTGKVKRGDLN